MTLKELIQVGVDLAESGRDPESAALYIERAGVPADAIAELAKRYAIEALGVRTIDELYFLPAFLSREDEDTFAEIEAAYFNTVGL